MPARRCIFSDRDDLPSDLFFDIEADPFVGDNGHEYLLGLVSADEADRGQADGAYEALWSFDAHGERQMFEVVVDRIHQRLRAHPDMHVYHFAPYETAALKRLASRLGTRVDEVDDLLRGRLQGWRQRPQPQGDREPVVESLRAGRQGRTRADHRSEARGGKAHWTGDDGKQRELTIDDIVVVAPYNAQVRALKEGLPAGAKVGTVDKFQGQEAPYPSIP